MACLFGHKWNGCKCSKCGKPRDENHSWNRCKCSRCGKTRDEQHEWGKRNDYTRNCNCIRCGKSITIQDIDKITDQSVLGVIAEFADNLSSNVCNVALKKLTDQRILANFAKNAYSSNFISGAALEKITDQALLLDISKFARSDDVRSQAAGKLTDKTITQKLSVEIVKNSNEHWARRKAVINIADQSTLEDIAINDEDIYVRIEAAIKLPNQTILADIAKNNDDINVRRNATKKLTDQETLAFIAKNITHIDSGIDGDTNRYIREIAINKLTNKDILTEIVNSEAANYLYTWEESHYTSSNDSDYVIIKKTFDLRDVARERLVKLK